MTLYELTEELLALYEMAEDPDIDEEALADTIEAVGGEIEIKAVGYAKVIKQMEADAEALKKEAERLKNRQKSIEGNIARIKKALENAMKATGQTKIKTEYFSFNIQKNPASLIVSEDVDINTIPAEYLTFSQPQIDKVAVKDALKNGEVFAWAKLEQTESLRIK